MIPIFKSLDQISTGYSVFEQDQVLTHDQLNSIADYADDQIRLTRTKLLGVGVAAGLRVSVASGTVKVTRGAGVTTDGDLLYLDGDTFNAFKAYDIFDYPYFYLNQDTTNPRIPVYELVRTGVTDPDKIPLTDFTTQTTFNLSDMVAVLIMESYRKDEDICSGTDCDNLGIEMLNRIKVLIVHRMQMGSLLASIGTAQGAFIQLSPLAADRPLMTAANTATPSALAGMYRTACNNIHANLTGVFNALYLAGSVDGTTALDYIRDLFAASPTTNWVNKLNTLNAYFATNVGRIQYYYDFLKDLVETYNEFHYLIFGETSICCPAPGLFPKHLLLGDLVPGTDPDARRTPWYPSPAMSHTEEEMDHAKFLLRKIDLLLQYVDINSTAVTDIRITPSMFEDESLEERAIPCYYPANNTNQLHRFWNFRLTRRNMATRNYSYHAAAYSATGGAATPFTKQIGRFSFFRIEGHMGKAVSDVMTKIKGDIKANNLPFSVVAVHVGTDRTKVSVKPAIRYNDLHRIHQVLRQDVVKQLDDVKTFSASFNAKIVAEPFTLTTTSEDCDCGGMSIRTLSSTSSADVTSKATTVQTPLNSDYLTYKLNSGAWQNDLKNTMVSAGQFKANLAPIVNTQFTTPYDSLIGNTHATWLPWLDKVIEKKDEQEDDKLLLPIFLDRNPAAEHFAGVERGGTFVVLYDNSNIVIGDLALPYYWYEVEEPAPAEPVLTRPPIRDTFVVDHGIKIQPSRGTLINTKVTSAKNEVYGVVDGKIAVNSQFQNQYVSLFENSLGLLGMAVPNAGQVKMAASVENIAMAGSGGTNYGDEYLTQEVNENNAFTKKFVMLGLRIPNETDGELLQRYESEYQKDQELMAESTYSLMSYIALRRLNCEAGSAAAQAAGAITPNLAKLVNTAVRSMLRTRLIDLLNQYDEPNFTALVNAMLQVLGR